MKSLIVLLLLATSLHAADPVTNAVPEITSKVTDIRGTNGRPDTRLETVYRGEAKILTILSLRNSQGAMVVSARAYFVAGRLAMIEGDENADGIFESVEVHNPNTDDFEMFIRQPDGSVKPLSTQTVEARKKQRAAVDHFGQKLLEKKTPPTDEEAQLLLQEARKEIQDAEKEKKHGEK
jgi:hypothetical protein